MTGLLLDWATDQIWLGMPVNNHGTTRQMVLKQVQKQTGQQPLKQTVKPSCPGCLRHVWDWFLLLVGNYRHCEEIPLPSQWQADVLNLTGHRVNPAEIQILGKLLALWRAA